MIEVSLSFNEATGKVVLNSNTVIDRMEFATTDQAHAVASALLDAYRRGYHEALNSLMERWAAKPIAKT